MSSLKVGQLLTNWACGLAILFSLVPGAYSQELINTAVAPTTTAFPLNTIPTIATAIKAMINHMSLE